MSRKFKIIGALTALVIIGAGYYLISPIWRQKKVDDPLPAGSNQRVITDNLGGMDEQTREAYEQQVSEMKDKNMPMADNMPNGQDMSMQGSFIARAHEVEGSARIIDVGDKKILRFENFKTINGPDLKIYLAADLGAEDYIDLGAIRGTEGNINYEIPAGTDLTKYNNVLVWCRAFSVLFSYAELK